MILSMDENRASALAAELAFPQPSVQHTLLLWHVRLGDVPGVQLTGLVLLFTA